MSRAAVEETRKALEVVRLCYGSDPRDWPRLARSVPALLQLVEDLDAELAELRSKAP